MTTDQLELAEDQIALERRENLTGDILPTVLQFENIENAIFQCAPAQNNIPKYVLLDDQFEVLAFPDLFPYGRFSYNSQQRSVKLALRKYFQQRLLNVDGRFAQNIEYIFCAQHMIDLQHIQSEINLAIRLARGRTLHGSKITAGTLRNPEAVHQLVRNQIAYKFLRNIRGSPPYWQHELHDVLAMLRSIGIPTWFLTLSAADLHWPEMIQAVAMQFGRQISQKEVLKMTMEERSKYLQQNPVTGARMFQHRVENFFTQYLLSDSNPIGQIVEYVIKIEFQMRGSPHAHCLLWVKDSPKINQDGDEIVCQFVDKYITAQIPELTNRTKCDIVLMKHLQKHVHSDYCRRNNSCRFGFPKPPSKETLISRPPNGENKDQIIKEAKDILTKVQYFLSRRDIEIENMSMEKMLEIIGVDIDDYINALQISMKGTTVILKCSIQDAFINGLNSDILALWGGNIDLQMVIDEVAAVMYVCSYMTKGEKAMGETLKRVAKECRDDDIQTQMKKIKKEFLGKRAFGGPESVMRILSMWLMKKSRKVTSVNCEMKEHRVSLPKTQVQLSKMDDDDTNVFATSIIDRYSARPNKLKEMCLASFAVNYEVSSTTDESNLNDDIELLEHDNTENTTGKYSNKIQLHGGLGTMRKRKKEAILKTRRYILNSDPEKYYHAKLLLYYPWSDENELISGFKSYEQSYISKQHRIVSNANKFNDDCEVFDLSPDEIENNIPQSVWDLTSPLISDEDAQTKRCGFTTLQKLSERKHQ